MFFEQTITCLFLKTSYLTQLIMPGKIWMSSLVDLFRYRILLRCILWYDCLHWLCVAGGMPESEPCQPTFEPTQVIAEITHKDGREPRRFTSVTSFIDLSLSVACLLVLVCCSTDRLVTHAVTFNHVCFQLWCLCGISFIRVGEVLEKTYGKGFSLEIEKFLEDVRYYQFIFLVMY